MKSKNSISFLYIPLKKNNFFLWFFLFSFHFLTGQNEIPADQTYDSIIEAKMNTWNPNPEKVLDLTKPLFEILQLVDSLDDDKDYYYKEKLYHWLGTIYFNIEQSDKSAKYYYKQLDISKQHNYNYGIASAYYNLGNNYLRCADYKKAASFYQNCLQFVKLAKLSNNSLMISASIELSKVEIFQKIYWKAESRLLGLMKLKDTSAVEAINNRLYIHIALSELYLLKNDIQKAVLYSQKADVLSDSTKSIYLQMVMLQNKSNILIKQKKLEEALKQLSEEEKFLTDHQLGDRRSIPLTKKLNILETLGNRQEELLRTYKELFAIKDKARSSATLANIMSYEMDYELKRFNKQKDMELLLEKKEKSLFRVQSYLYLTIALLLIITLVALGVWNKNRNKIILLKIEKEMDEKQLAYQKLQLNNASLTEFALQTERMQDRFNELKNKVTDALTSGTDKEKFNQIKNEINIELQNPALNPIEISNKVKSIKDELLFKLSRAHPTLTEKDKRLCTLLMLNLSSKEMANILNIQEESVEKSRSRLRKKMNLSSNQNFIEYFNSIK